MMFGSVVGSIVRELEIRDLQRQVNERATLALFHDRAAAKEARRKAASDRMKAMWVKQRAEQA